MFWNGKFVGSHFFWLQWCQYWHDDPVHGGLVTVNVGMSWLWPCWLSYCVWQVEVLYGDEPLKDYYTLMDIAYFYEWRRVSDKFCTFKKYLTNVLNLKRALSLQSITSVVIQRTFSRFLMLQSCISMCSSYSATQKVSWKENEAGLLSFYLSERSPDFKSHLINKQIQPVCNWITTSFL